MSRSFGRSASRAGTSFIGMSSVPASRAMPSSHGSRTSSTTGGSAAPSRAWSSRGEISGTLDIAAASEREGARARRIDEGIDDGLEQTLVRLRLGPDAPHQTGFHDRRLADDHEQPSADRELPLEASVIDRDGRRERGGAVPAAV